MKLLRFLLIGILFGIIMTKSEAVSWYRIQEMFRFQSFHMYGIIGSALFFGIIFIQLIKRLHIKNAVGQPIVIEEKPMLFWANLLGGSVFGLGWALAGACPGPVYVLIGQGYWIFGLVLVSALVGTLVYGMLKSKLPH